LLLGLSNGSVTLEMGQFLNKLNSLSFDSAFLLLDITKRICGQKPKHTTHKWEKLFKNQIPDKGLICIMNKELNNQVGYGSRHL
jgi:hypothetical protein